MGILNWVFLKQSLQWNPIQTVRWAYGIWKYDRTGGCIPSTLMWRMTGDSVQLGWGPHISHRAIPRAPLPRGNHDLASPRTSDTKDRQQRSTQDRSYNILYTCISYMTYHHFFVMLWSHRPATVTCEWEREITKVWMPEGGNHEGAMSEAVF